MTALLFADQNLMAPNLTQIADDFGFTELERDVKLGGDISLVFWMLGGVVTLMVGWLGDRGSRKRLLIGVVLLGETACLLTGFAETYTQLFWLRAATGIGIGGVFPLVYSLLGDYYGDRHRARAAAWLGTAISIGIAVGQLVAGFVGPTHGWRLPFVLIAVPNFLLLILFWLTVHEPRRGTREDSLHGLFEAGHAYTPRIDWQAYKNIFRVPTNVVVFLMAIPGTVPWGVFFIFFNDFYAQDKGFSVETATLISMAVGVGLLTGGLLGGLLGNVLYNRDARYLGAWCGGCTIAGTVPVALLLNYPSQIGVLNPSPTVPAIIGVVGGVLIGVAGPNVRAILLNVNSPETRSSAFSLYNMADDLGKGLGPAFVALLITQLGRVAAFNVANLLWVVSGVMSLALVATLPRDVSALAARLRALADAYPSSR